MNQLLANYEIDPNVGRYRDGDVEALEAKYGHEASTSQDPDEFNNIPIDKGGGQARSIYVS